MVVLTPPRGTPRVVWPPSPGRAAPARRPLASAACTVGWAALRWRELRRYPISRQRRLAALPVELASDVLTGGALLVGAGGYVLLTRRPAGPRVSLAPRHVHRQIDRFVTKRETARRS